MRSQGPLNTLGVGRLRNHLLHLRILERCHMRLDMRLLVLPEISLDGLALEDVHILRNRIPRRNFVFQRNNLVWILDSKNLQHLTM